MFDRHLQPLVAPLVQPLASLFAKAGVAADHLTILGLLIGIGSVPLLAGENYPAALGCIIVNRFCDGLDGAVARMRGPTRRGAFLDIALDFFFYASVPFGFALANPQSNSLPAVFLMLGFAGTSSSFLAFAVLARRDDPYAGHSPHKGIVYLGGLTEGTETIVLFVSMCLWPSYFPVLACVFAIICLVTTLARWRLGWIAFSDHLP